MDLVPYTLTRCLYLRTRYVPSEHVVFCAEHEFLHFFSCDVIPHLRTRCLPSEHSAFVSASLSFLRNTNFIISPYMMSCRRVIYSKRFHTIGYPTCPDFHFVSQGCQTASQPVRVLSATCCVIGPLSEHCPENCVWIGADAVES